MLLVLVKAYTWWSQHGAVTGFFCGFQSLTPNLPSELGLLYRPEAKAALNALRASGWIDHSTRAVSVHFTLYNPPTRLFTSVTLSVEVLPAGDLVPSSLVESFRIFGGDSAPWYSLVLPEVSSHLNLAVWTSMRGGASLGRAPPPSRTNALCGPTSHPHPCHVSCTHQTSC